MTTTPWGFLFNGAADVLVSTEFGTGWWDSARRELRLPFSVHVSPEPKLTRPASVTEAQLFFSLKHETRNRMTADYERLSRRNGGRTGD